MKVWLVMLKVLNLEWGENSLPKEQVLEYRGKIIKCLPNAMFEIKLVENGHTVIGYTAGKLKKGRIRILEGDEVQCLISPYDITKCRVTWRF